MAKRIIVEKESEPSLDYEEMKDKAVEGYASVISFIKKKPVESFFIALISGFCLGRLCQKIQDMFKK